MNGAPHIPVLLDEVVRELRIAEGDRIVDGTFGAGGYSRAILEAGAGEVIGFDRDPDAIAAARSRLDDERLTLIAATFSQMDERVDGKVDGVVLDLGVSSMQIDDAARGFAFKQDGPLDMRMEQSGPTAADVVNETGEGELARIIKTYGDEPRARRVAAAIVKARPLARTGELADLVRKTLGYHKGMKTDPATRTFQAIRIHLNAELEELEKGLSAAERILKPGGRLAVVSFHSLEDRIVKTFLRERSGNRPQGSRHLPQVEAGPAATFGELTKAIAPGADEVARNPRSRSSKLRAATRTGAPAWGVAA